ncbi:MAG: inositol monophosphatase family protein [Pseudomonadales bacterium]|nr:inositol monophosphatase family protein [Pseudomonadales bacterium]
MVNRVGDGFGFSDRVVVADRERAQYLGFAERVVSRAGIETLPFFRTDLEVEDKRSGGVFDPVTAADRACELVIREAIRAEFPDHGIYGEEYGYEPGCGLTWVIDPIDGTRAFMSGMLHWGVLLGLFDGQDTIVGAMGQPFVGELFSGDGRHARYQRGETKFDLRTSSCASVHDAVFGTTGLEWFGEGELGSVERLIEQVRLSRVGGDCYIHAMLAMGSMDISSDANLQCYDIQALIPIVRGAGGVVTTFHGENPCLGGTVLCAANGPLHELALDIVRA